MPLRICLSTANTLSYPQGGYLWIFINWALGFRACGCDIAWLDVVPPSMPAEAVKVATERLRNALRPFGLDTAVLVGHLTEEPTSLDDSIGSFDFLSVVSRRHFFFVAPDWRHVTGTMMAALGGLRGFVGERR